MIIDTLVDVLPFVFKVIFLSQFISHVVTLILGYYTENEIFSEDSVDLKHSVVTPIGYAFIYCGHIFAYLTIFIGIITLSVYILT